MINFHWILTCQFRKLKFLNFLMFYIFGRGAKKIIPNLLIYESSLLFDQMIGLSYLENELLGFSISLAIFTSNLKKRPPKHISASNRKFHPKGGIRQRRKESASHHYENYLKIMVSLNILIDFHWILTCKFRKLKFAIF